MAEPLSEERLAEIRRDWSGGVMGASTVFELVAEVERLRAAGKHLGGALDALGEVIRAAVRLAADTGDPAAGLREIASYAQQAGVLDDREPAGSPS